MYTGACEPHTTCARGRVAAPERKERSSEHPSPGGAHPASGPGHLNRWVAEERNVYADYKRIFNQEPPEISGVAIMTDSDNTGESAVAWYGDIVFGPPE